MASTSPPARRRFLPQPVETSARSSKRQHIEQPEESSSPATDNTIEAEKMVSTVKPKKFLPQPIEETTRSSRRKNADKDTSSDKQEKSTHSDDSTLPGYPTSKPSPSTRRFAPEPVETSTRSSRRKFAVEPVETTTRTSKSKVEKEDTSTTSKPRRRFAPEPIETTTVRRRRRNQDEDSNESPPESMSESSSRASSRQSTGSKRFSPELIETAKGSYRHKKDPDSPKSAQHSASGSPSISRTSTRSPEPADHSESRFSAAALAKKHHEQHRKHSYCVPNLPCIDSESGSESGSDEPSTPSLIESPSSTDNEHHKLNKIQENAAESYTDYVLSLTNSHDRRKLQEQAMAAYINEVPHEQVSHFAADEDEDDLVHVGTLSTEKGADPRTFRRSSQAEHDWEMQNMRKHHEQLEQAKRELHEDTAGVSRFSAAALAARHHLGQVHKYTPKDQKQKDEDAEYARMKQAASPPMLGEDIVFPFTISPKMTRCDVDHPPRPRRADSDSDDNVSIASSTQLWAGQSSNQNKPAAGLWMGMCQKPPESSRPTTPTRSGLQTPAFEIHNPFETRTPGRGARTPGRGLPRPYGHHLLPTPPQSAEGSQDEFTSSIDKKLQLEKQIEEEFPPRVITQIYNYLSLGFPSIACDFDAELSKISRISIKDLRKDDRVATGTIRGYVGAPESAGTWEEDEDGTVRGCRRWDALKLYVKEWARQSPNFTVEQRLPVVQDPTLAHYKTVKAEAWGATVRKGSWAL